ncbi:MAG: acyloxyacyl hydrolase [Pseudomonadota bacterium]
MRCVAFLWGVLFAVADWTGAHAESVIDEARVGVLAQSCCGYSPDNEQGVGINFEAAFRSPGFLRIIGAPRPLIGGTLATDSDGTNHAYAALEWRYDFSKYFVSGAVGGAVHDGTLNDGGDPFLAARGDTIFFGCRVLIKVGLNAGVRLTDRINAAAHWSHISNGTLCRPNNGLDQLGVRIGVGF